MKHLRSANLRLVVRGAFPIKRLTGLDSLRVCWKGSYTCVTRFLEILNSWDLL
jgi:hypothetical protein